jgi:hypothetical protein
VTSFDDLLEAASVAMEQVVHEMFDFTHSERYDDAVEDEVLTAMYSLDRAHRFWKEAR